VWRIPYRTGDRIASAAPERIASVREQSAGGHSTTSVAVAGDRLYASVGSSCNACTETDPTRAKIFEMSTSGAGMAPKAVNIRNAVALAVDPETNALWAGVAGQDELAHGHPYEIFDDVSAHSGTADYGWPVCFENRTPVSSGIDCSHVAVPRVVFPAYETPIGAAFYPLHPTGAHAFPAEYRGGAFVALHGSWHQPLVPPRVVYVPLASDEPAKPVDWSDPSAQWRPFLSGFQLGDQTRLGRPTGVAVGPEGSLFVADDLASVVYRIRPR
jgi:glucose/arabinose dehydrogenase